MKCPCEQCICLAICKCRIRAIHQAKQTGTFTSILQCQILDDYHKRIVPGSTRYRMRIDKTRKVYDLNPLFKGRYNESCLL